MWMDQEPLKHLVNEMKIDVNAYEWTTYRHGIVHPGYEDSAICLLANTDSSEFRASVHAYVYSVSALFKGGLDIIGAREKSIVIDVHNALLHIDDNNELMAVLAVGYPDEEPKIKERNSTEELILKKV